MSGCCDDKTHQVSIQLKKPVYTELRPGDFLQWGFDLIADLKNWKQIKLQMLLWAVWRKQVFSFQSWKSPGVDNEPVCVGPPPKQVCVAQVWKGFNAFARSCPIKKNRNQNVTTLWVWMQITVIKKSSAPHPQLLFQIMTISPMIWGGVQQYDSSPLHSPKLTAEPLQIVPTQHSYVVKAIYIHWNGRFKSAAHLTWLFFRFLRLQRWKKYPLSHRRLMDTHQDSAEEWKHTHVWHHQHYKEQTHHHVFLMSIQTSHQRRHEGAESADFVI